jgi:hypothetical protein
MRAFLPSRATRSMRSSSPEPTAVQPADARASAARPARFSPTERGIAIGLVGAVAAEIAAESVAERVLRAESPADEIAAAGAVSDVR